MIRRESQMAGVENTEPNMTFGQEEQKKYPVAYPPIPRCVIKEEPQSNDEDEDNEEMKHLMAYPPLPQVDIKEEWEIGKARDEFVSDGEQVKLSLT